MILSVTQTEAIDYLEDKDVTDVLFGGGAGGGKSALLCYFALKMALKYPGSRGLIGRAMLKTLRETTLVTFFEIAKMQGVAHTFKYIAPTTIKFDNGSEILLKDLYAYPSDPDFDELGSLELTYACIDECNQISQKAKNIVRSRIRFKLVEFGLTPKMIMTCNPAKNWVKSEYREPWVKGLLPNNKKFVESLLDDNTEFSGREMYKQNLMQLDKASKERLLLGNWDYNDDPSSLMTPEAIESIFYNEHVVGNGKKYITADIARMGTDKVVIRVWDGWRVLERKVLTKQRLTATASEIRSLAHKYSIPMFRVLCDEDGVGGGVVDILNCKGFVANSAPFKHNPKNTNYDMLKSQCAWHLADMVNDGLVYEEADEATRDLLREELEYIKQRNIDKDGKRSLLQKERIKIALGRSPDDSDTYIMRAYFDLAVTQGVSIVRPKGVSEFRVASNGRSNINI